MLGPGMLGFEVCKVVGGRAYKGCRGREFATLMMFAYMQKMCVGGALFVLKH